ncbi:hypothetical protein C5167_022547, partial [Papaver somniferum]
GTKSKWRTWTWLILISHKLLSASFTSPALSHLVFSRGSLTFDKVFGPAYQQNDMYDLAVVPIVNEVLEGFNQCRPCSANSSDNVPEKLMERSSYKESWRLRRTIKEVNGSEVNILKPAFGRGELQHLPGNHLKSLWLRMHNWKYFILLLHRSSSQHP